MPEDKKPAALNKSDIHHLIRTGDVKFIKQGVESGAIKVPDDLINFSPTPHFAAGRTALHVAAFYGQVEMLKFLVTGLKYDENGQEKLWGLNVHVKDNFGETALDIAKNYKNRANPDRIAPRIEKLASFVSGPKDVDTSKSNYEKFVDIASGPFRFLQALVDTAATAFDIAKNSIASKTLKSEENNEIRNLMEYFLKIAEMPAGKNRDEALYNASHRSVIKNTSSGSKNNSDLEDNKLSEAIRLKYKQIEEQRNQIEEQKINKQNKFLSDVKMGELTEDKIKEYAANGVNVGCTNGSLNALHIAIKNGHPEIVKILIDGVYNQRAQDGSPIGKPIIKFELDDKCEELLNSVKIHPDAAKFKEYEKIAKYFEEYKEPAPSPSHPKGKSIIGNEISSPAIGG